MTSSSDTCCSAFDQTHRMCLANRVPCADQGQGGRTGYRCAAQGRGAVGRGVGRKRSPLKGKACQEAVRVCKGDGRVWRSGETLGAGRGGQSGPSRGGMRTVGLEERGADRAWGDVLFPDWGRPGCICLWLSSEHDFP